MYCWREAFRSSNPWTSSDKHSCSSACDEISPQFGHTKEIVRDDCNRSWIRCFWSVFFRDRARLLSSALKNSCASSWRWVQIGAPLVNWKISVKSNGFHVWPVWRVCSPCFNALNNWASLDVSVYIFCQLVVRIVSAKVGMAKSSWMLLERKQVAPRLRIPAGVGWWMRFRWFKMERTLESIF